MTLFRYLKHWIMVNPDDPPKRYKFPDPTTERFADAVRTARHYPDEMTKDQGFQLAEVAEAYHLLMTHPSGTEAMIKKVRAIRRAIRDKPATEGGEG